MRRIFFAFLMHRYPIMLTLFLTGTWAFPTIIRYWKLFRALGTTVHTNRQNDWWTEN